MSRSMRARRHVGMLEQMLADARAEVAMLRDNAAILVAALNTLPIGVVVLDAAGREVVRNARARLGVGDRQADALITRAVEDVLAVTRTEGDAARTLDLHQPARRSLVISAQRLPAGATVVITEDITARVQIDAVRRDFVANVSHELRTPIGALAVLAETILGERDPAVVNRLAQRMAVESERAVRLIEDLLDLSRVEGDGADRREPIPIARVVESATALVHDVARSAGVSINSEGVARDVEVVGDERQLISAVRNLLENAVRYSGAGGRVDVTAGWQGQFAVVVVRDAGVGIPARDLDRVFERFYRVDRARSRHTGGTGLGLAIVRHVAQNHGGDVTVHSVEGEGSEFTMRLSAQ